ncbi:hypothetical protein ACFQV8_25155 [Pseudonocardia benzenivorans]
MGVVVVSSDGIELAGLCDRVLIFSRGHVVEELVGDDISESRITGAALTATTHREKDTHRAGPAVRWFAGDTAPMAMVALAVLGLGLWTSLTSSFYLTTPSIAGLLALVAVLGFVALGQTVALMIGAVDLSVGPLMGFVVVAESFFLTAESMPLDRVLGWVLLFAIPLAVGLVNWALVDVVRMNAIVATLITYIALQALSLVLRPQPGGLFDSRITEALTFTLGPVPIAFILMVLVAAGMQFWLRRTRTGIALRSVGSEPERARLNGLGAPRLRLVGFLLCSLLAGLAALFLLAQVGSGDPTSGVDYTLTSISAAVIGGASIFGGRGSFVGTIAAALLVTQAIGAVTFLGLDAAWSSYLPGAMTLVAVAVYSRTRHLARTH